jgi:uncharacterized protein
MSIEKNVQIVKDFFAALGRRDKQGLLALSAEDIEWIIPGEDWPLAGTHRGHAGLADVLQKANETVETSYPEPPEFLAQGDRVMVVGFATGRIKATNRTFEDHWVFAITVRNGKLTNVREYVDTQALARASEMPASPSPDTDHTTLSRWKRRHLPIPSRRWPHFNLSSLICASSLDLAIQLLVGCCCFRLLRSACADAVGGGALQLPCISPDAFADDHCSGSGGLCAMGAGLSRVQLKKGDWSCE